MPWANGLVTGYQGQHGITLDATTVVQPAPPTGGTRMGDATDGGHQRAGEADIIDVPVARLTAAAAGVPGGEAHARELAAPGQPGK